MKSATLAFALAGLAACSLSPLAAQGPQKAVAPPSELDGYWQFVKEETNPPPGGPRGWGVRLEGAVVIQGDQILPMGRNGAPPFNSQPTRIRIESDRVPKTIDFKVFNDWWLAIYKVNAGELTIATRFSKEERPESFATSVDAGAGRAFHVRTYKLVKESPAEAAAKAAGALDPKQQVLDGLWRLDSHESNQLRDGLDDRFRGHDALYFAGDECSFASSDGWRCDSPTPFDCEPNASPPTVDFKFPRGTIRGIYKIVGDELVVASNGMNGERPRWFTTRLSAGAGRAGEVRKFTRVRPTARILQLKARPDLDQTKQVLDGYWIVEYDKRNVPLFARVANLRMPEAIFVDKGKWTPATNKGALIKNREPSTFVADPTKPIPTIDLKFEGKEAIRGIYKVEGDTLYFATDLNDETRPKAFTTNLTAGADRAKCVIRFRRGDKSSDANDCAAPVASPTFDDLASPQSDRPRPPAHELNGYWVLQKQENNGPRRWKAHWEKGVYIDGADYWFVQEDGSFARGNPIVVHVDSTTTPKSFDYVSGKETWRGIYKLENGILTVATKFSPDQRPESFSTALEAGAGRATHVRVYKFVSESPETAQQKALPKLDAAKQRLDGLWVLDEVEANGPHNAGEYPFRWEEAIYLEGNHWHSPNKNGVLRFHDAPMSFRNNPNAVPPTIDANFHGKQWHGIYKIENDQLTIAFVGPEADPPRWFTTKLTAGAGRANLLRTYRRVSPTDDVVRLKEKVRLDPARQKLDGKWIVESQSYNGSDVRRFELGQSIAFDQGDWRSSHVDRFRTTELRGSYVADPSAPIPKIDLKFKLDEFRGIYKVEGDKLYLASNLSNDDRPCLFTTSLTAGPGRAKYVAILKRAP